MFSTKEKRLKIPKTDETKEFFQQEEICGGCIANDLYYISHQELVDTEKADHNLIKKLRKKYPFLNE